MVARGISIGILILILVIIIVYVIVVLMMAAHKTGIFSPYTPPAPPASQNAFYPLGTVTPLCQQDIDDRNTLICAMSMGATAGLTLGQIDTTGWTGACDPTTWPKSTTPCPVSQTPSPNVNPSTALYRATANSSPLDLG